MLQHPGAGLQTGVGQRQVGGHDDISGPALFGDPAVGHVRAVGHEDMPHQGVLRRAQPAISDQDHLYQVAGGHPFGLGLHRAGVGIDI